MRYRDEAPLIGDTTFATFQNWTLLVHRHLNNDQRIFVERCTVLKLAPSLFS